jgi:hypothetical protein
MNKAQKSSNYMSWILSPGKWEPEIGSEHGIWTARPSLFMYLYCCTCTVRSRRFLKMQRMRPTWSYAHCHQGMLRSSVRDGLEGNGTWNYAEQEVTEMWWLQVQLSGLAYCFLNHSNETTSLIWTLTKQKCRLPLLYCMKWEKCIRLWELNMWLLCLTMRSQVQWS